MKSLNTLALTTLLILTALATQAQHTQVTTYIERTVVGPKVGTSIGYEFRDLVEVGGFYQKAISTATGNEPYGYSFEKEFYGAYFSYPLMADIHHTTLKLNVRTGVTNGQNFLITPSVLANYHPIKNLSVGAGVGVRVLRPTLQASIKFSL